MPRRQGGSRRDSRGNQTPKKLIAGIVEVTRKGTGYLPWETGKEDVEIFQEKLNGALNGDQVEVELLSLHPRPRGRVKKIVERAKTEFVATMKGGKAVPQDTRFAVSIDVGPSSAKASEGDKVLIKLLSFD